MQALPSFFIRWPVAFFSAFSLAGSAVADCVSENPQLVHWIHLQDGETTCAQANAVVRTLTQVLPNLRDLIQPPPLALLMAHRGFSSDFRAPDLLQITELSDVGDHPGPTSPAAISQPAWIHELGHAFFSANLAPQSSTYQNLMTYLGRRNQLAVRDFQLFDQRTNVRALLRSSNISRRQRDAAGAELARIDAQSEQLENESTAYLIDGPGLSRAETRLDRAVTPYDEFFADVVAVVSTDDPQALSKSLDDPTLRGLDRLDIEGRDFSYPSQAQTWTAREDHILLAPARFACWGFYLQAKKTSTKSQFISAVFRAIAQEILHHRPKDPYVMNLQLIRRMQRELRPFTTNALPTTRF